MSPADPRRHDPRASAYAGLLDRSAGWLDGAARTFPAVARARPALEEQLEVVRELRARLDAPLLILIAGGTGAGKSTLLNALAGAEIARVSAVRPCTRSLACYYHVQNELAIEWELLRNAEKSPHRRPELLDKVLIDAPDFDSTAPENEALLRRALEEADLVLIVATPEKYADQELYEILRDYRAGRAFVFILNKADFGPPEELVQDFRAEVEKAGFPRPTLLVVSARAALERKLGGGGDSGGGDADGDGAGDAGAAGDDRADERDFPRLEALVERELTRARVREIKRLNLDELVRRFLERAASFVPDDLEERVSRWRREGEAVADRVRRDAADRLARALRSDRGFRRHVEARLGTAYTRLFGVYQTFVHALRALREPGRPRSWLSGGDAVPPVELEARLADEDRDVVLPGLVLAARRIADAGETLGIAGGAADLAGTGVPDASRSGRFALAPPAAVAPTLPLAPSEGARSAPESKGGASGALPAAPAPGAAPTAVPLAAADAEAMMTDLYRAVDRRLAEAVRTLPGPEGRPRKFALEDLLFNIPPIALVAYAIGRWFYEWQWNNTIYDTAYFVASALVLLVLLVLQGSIADRLARRRADRFLEAAEEALEAAADEALAAPLRRRVEAAAASAAAVARRLESLRSEAEAVRAATESVAGPAESRAGARAKSSV